MRYFWVLNRDMVENYSVDCSHVVISVYEPGTEKPDLSNDLGRLDTLYLSFWDFDEPYNNYKIFNKEIARKVINFFLKWQDQIDMVIVNCELGVSRSAGIAAALCNIKGYDDTTFFKRFCPNMRVYRIILNVWESEYIE